MTGMKHQSRNAFDFSQDALDFKARLWKKIQTQSAATSVEELEDDDLEWVNAAGMPVRPPEDEKWRG